MAIARGPVTRSASKRFDVLLSLALICGVVASLALGVLVAYSLCVGMFTMFRMHAQRAAATRQASVAPALRAAGN